MNKAVSFQEALESLEKVKEFVLLRKMSECNELIDSVKDLIEENFIFNKPKQTTLDRFFKKTF